MIGDHLTYHPEYKAVSNVVIAEIEKQMCNGARLCIAVGGESGSGKTSLAYALYVDIQQYFGVKGFLFHGDDYFFYPPKDNHNRRLKDISIVGTGEVDLDLLSRNILEFKKNEAPVHKPLVNYDENKILEEKINPGDFQFCLVEGTYTMLLENIDYKVFIETNYKETKMSRLKRARDIINDFNEEVLEIEHNIIKTHRSYADLIYGKNTIQFK
ncbi:hypothetical protein [Seonamhaeicola sp.]|uniref:hypothetical protein n=1 Tax=Seonamhaeicola sp. TaxID=1912245 RepID=UPI0026306BDA|nr:hypothetical protein [Seonamhaeicola sp.]